MIRFFPINIAPSAYVFLVLVCAGLAMYGLAREFLPSPHAVVAAMFYTASPYQLLVAYQRSAFAELITGAVLPLVLLFALRLANDSRALIWLAVVFGLTWLTDFPGAVVVTYTVALLLVSIAVQRRSLRVLFNGVAALALGFALVAFFLVPATYEQRWVEIEQAVTPDFAPDTNFLSMSWSHDPESGSFPVVLSVLAACELVLVAGAMAFSRAWRRNAPLVWWSLAIVCPVSAVMMFPVTSWLWNHMPKLRYVQFPWRFLLVLTCVMVFLLIAALRNVRTWKAALIAIAIMLAGGVGTGWNAPWIAASAEDVRTAILTDHGYVGSAAFLPRGSSNDAIRDVLNAPRVVANANDLSAVSSNTSIHVTRWAPEEKTFTVEAPEAIRVVLHMLNYPGWQVRVSGKVVAAESHPKTGQLVVPVPSGRSQVTVRFTHTKDRIFGMAISACTLLILLMLHLRMTGASVRER